MAELTRNTWGAQLPYGYPCHALARKEKHLLAASTGVEKATAIPTVIDEDELAKAREDERWREFCLRAERCVAETTRPHPPVSGYRS